MKFNDFDPIAGEQKTRSRVVLTRFSGFEPESNVLIITFRRFFPHKITDQVQFSVGRPGLEPGTDSLRRGLFQPDRVQTNASVDLDLSLPDQELHV